MILSLATVVSAQINMPDPAMIAGKALPAPELPDGTVSVRVVRESIGNNIVGQDVTVKAGDVSRAGRTDEAGRAQMTGFPSGVQGTAEATVSGETLVSDPFEVPSIGGIRIILIAGMKEAAERRAKEKAAEEAAPAVKGTVVIGGDSRVMLEFRDDELTVYYLLEIVNTARTRVDIGRPLVFALPKDAKSVTLLEGSSQLATVRPPKLPWNWDGIKGRLTDMFGPGGDPLTVTGPFPPGTTSVQVAFGLEHKTDKLTLTQTWPAALSQVMVMAQKVGNLQMTSAQLNEQEEGRAQNGTLFIIGGGPALPAGGTLTLDFAGLPAHARWPQLTALGLGALILLVGGWMAMGSGTSDASAPQRLAVRRESLYGELVKLEEQRRAGRVDGSKYASRRQKLLGDLERVYGELDGRAGGGESAA